MKDFTELVPITFVLGFYVALVVKRWWDQYLAIPWVDRSATQIGAYVQVCSAQVSDLRKGTLGLTANLGPRGTSQPMWGPARPNLVSPFGSKGLHRRSTIS